MSKRPTRGTGFLEGVLSNRRAVMGDKLIDAGLRQGAILDIGCGASACFLRRTRFKEKHGLERALTAEDVENAAQHGIALRHFDIERMDELPFDDGYFAVVTLLAVLEHVDDECGRHILMSAARVIQPGGTLIVTTPNAWTDGLLRILARIGIVSPEEIDEHKRLYTCKALRQLLDSIGFGADAVHTGSFELGMNLWASAHKP